MCLWILDHINLNVHLVGPIMDNYIYPSDLCPSGEAYNGNDHTIHPSYPWLKRISGRELIKAYRARDHCVNLDIHVVGPMIEMIMFLSKW